MSKASWQSDQQRLAEWNSGAPIHVAYQRSLLEVGHEEAPEYCPICGAELEWMECQAGCDDGQIDGYEEDPMWYSPGETYRCSACKGKGGWLECPNLPHQEQGEG